MGLYVWMGGNKMKYAEKVKKAFNLTWTTQARVMPYGRKSHDKQSGYLVSGVNFKVDDLKQSKQKLKLIVKQRLMDLKNLTLDEIEKVAKKLEIK